MSADDWLPLVLGFLFGAATTALVFAVVAIAKSNRDFNQDR